MAENSLLSAQKIWADKWKVKGKIVNGSRPHKILLSEQENKMKLAWKEIGGAVTPGGDPAYMCPVCFHGEHVYGIEHPEPIHKCQVCGAELIYPWELICSQEEQNDNRRNSKK